MRVVKMGGKKKYYFSLEQVDSHLDFLAKKLHNALFSYEEKNPNAYKSIHSIQIELMGLGSLHPFMKENQHFKTLISKLEDWLYEEFILLDDNHTEVRREILNCMNLIDRVREILPDHME